MGGSACRPRELADRFRQDILVVAALDERHHELVFLPAS
jgi:hypothetical protein